MKKTKMIAILMSSIMTISAVSALSSSASGEKAYEKHMEANGYTRYEDSGWWHNEFDDLYSTEAVYYKELANNSVEIKSVGHTLSEIYLEFPREYRAYSVAEKIMSCNPNFEITDTRLYSDGLYHFVVRQRDENKNYEMISSKSAKAVYEQLKDILVTYTYTPSEYTTHYRYVRCLTAYSSWEKIAPEYLESIKNYVEENNIPADIVYYKEGDTDIYGAAIDEDTMWIIPKEEMSVEEQLVLAKEIYEATGAYPYHSANHSDLKDENHQPVNIDVLASLEGDANCDTKVTVADSVAILQHLGNPDRYPMTPQGIFNADADGDGITAKDALTIQNQVL